MSSLRSEYEASAFAAWLGRLNDLLGTDVFTGGADGGDLGEVSTPLVGKDLDSDELAGALGVLAAKLYVQENFGGQQARAVVALRKELLAMARGMAQIEEYVWSRGVLPGSDPRPAASDMMPGPVLGVGEQVQSTLLLSTRGLCGLGLDILALDDVLLDVILTGHESGLALGSWTLELSAGTHHCKLSLMRGLVVSEAQVDLVVRAVDGSARVGPGTARAAPDPGSGEIPEGGAVQVAPRLYRWAAGFRMPPSWGIHPTFDAAADTDPSHSGSGLSKSGSSALLLWEDVSFWSAPTSRRTLSRDKGRVEATGSFVSRRQDYVQVHPLPGCVVLGWMRLPYAQPTQLRVVVRLAHEDAAESRIWVGTVPAAEISAEAGPSPSVIKSSRIGMVDLPRGEDGIVFDVTSLGRDECLVVAAAVPDGQSNEYAWVRAQAAVAEVGVIPK